MLSTEIGFVHFNNTLELPSALFECGANTHIHIPRGLLGNSYLFRKRDRGNTLLGSCEEVDRNEPLLKGNLTLAKKSTGLYDKVPFALFAPIPLLVRETEYLGVLAVRTEIAFCEAYFFKVLSTRLLAIKMGGELRKCSEIGHTSSSIFYFWNLSTLTVGNRR